VRGDMFTAMRVTLQHERNRAVTEALGKSGSRPEKAPLTCRQALAWTTIQGARVAGLDHRTGSLAVGKQADIILISSEDISMFPVRDPIGSIVMQGGVATVDTVLIAGRVMKRNGRLVYPRLAERMAALRRSGDRILTDFGYLPRQAA
jgi:5-methylthioadenosine/S-adenosylhomocysteine deaminase